MTTAASSDSGPASPLANLAQFARTNGAKAANYTAAAAKDAVARAKGAFNNAKSYFSETIYCPGRANAEKADKEANSADPKFSGEGAIGFESEKPGGKLEGERGIEVTGDLWSKQNTFLQYGDDDDNLVIGQESRELDVGYSYDPEKQERFAGIKGKAEVVAIKGKLSGKKAYGLLEGELEGEALAARATGKLGAEWDESGGGRVAGAVGGEAVLISGKAKGQIKATPKTLWDSSCNLVAEGSKYCDAPKWLDHGIVAGVEGEIGVGAAAKAEGAIGKIKEGAWGVSGGAKAGAGPMAGFKAFLGFI